MAVQYKVVQALFAVTFKELSESGTGKGKNNTILMGSYVTLLNQQTDQWQLVTAFGIKGWIEKKLLGDSPDLKCFYIDVGQGDAALLEVGNDTNGVKILIDGGPGDNLARYLTKWQYKYYLNRDLRVHIDYIFISHFDKDHYRGLIDIINDDRFTIGTIFHNGIAKFNNQKNTFPVEYNCELGTRVKVDNTFYLVTSFDSIDDLEMLRQKGGMLDLLVEFIDAVKKAKFTGRLTDFRRLDFQSTLPPKRINEKQLLIDVLGPVTKKIGALTGFAYFGDEAHTINGHSLVLKITFGDRSFLFGGDLNILSEEQLIRHYGTDNPFEVDVAKSCHHGASEFSTAFMAKVNPIATVISSGDNESYSHPRADAIGCAGKYSQSERPLVFSTELARSSSVTADKIKFGMINLRCNGADIIMAQMKEAGQASNIWDLYQLE